MKAIFRKYQSEDFMRIRDFLISTYQKFGKECNWTIERWNFSFAMSRAMHDVSKQHWEESIGVWESNGEIVGIVNSEGESSGEAFFQIDKSNIQDSILEEMFAFTEDKLWIEKEGKRFVQLRIPDGDEKRESMALNRGFLKLEWSEITSELHAPEIQNLSLPKGFHFKTGDELSDSEKGIAHAKAFGYIDKDIYVKRVPLGYQSLRQMPDYKADLDLSVVCETGEIVSFCTMWYDQANKIGILEPVGTIPESRKMGLGRAVIYEAIRRIKQEGAVKVYVGSEQDFYMAIGFRKKYKCTIWEKTV